MWYIGDKCCFSYVAACIEEDTECNKDKLGYDAIGRLHALIDDDHNGNVDQSESDEVFMMIVIHIQLKLTHL